MGPTGNCARIVISLEKKKNRIVHRRRTHRRGFPRDWGQGRRGRWCGRARGGVAQLVGELALAGEVGGEQSLHGRGSGDLSTMDSTIPATACSGDDG